MAGGEEFDPKALQEDLRRIRERLRRLGGEGEAVMKKLDETITEAEKRLGPRAGPAAGSAGADAAPE